MPAGDAYGNAAANGYADQIDGGGYAEEEEGADVDGSGLDDDGAGGPRKAFGDMKIWVGTWNMGASDPFAELDLDNEAHYAEVRAPAGTAARVALIASSRAPVAAPTVPSTP